ARLDIREWSLDKAAAIARSILSKDPRDEEAALMLGRIRLLDKDYDEALEWAERVQEWNPRNAGAYLLEADTRFWAQDPAGAEAPLVRALALDPFNADARFSYGYAIWRRVDATQLDDMAAQWNLALAVDPLHYITHWHWGNGHTNLTYADYAEPTDSVVRALLAPADSLISLNQIPQAIDIIRDVQSEYPGSVLPAMMRGSAYYMAYDMDRSARLDSAQAAFIDILERKENYGPAHNGLAAVIKARQAAYLASFDSLEAVIANTPLPDDPHFEAVFADVDYYPGVRVKKMVRAQLGPSIAYVPLLHRLGREFVIPPLHKDLAEAMDRPSFRTSTTFDNRQWMDIRGVGSGATAIEYVERGSHWERNVVAHEYTHLFHGQVLTDAESRRIRDLYHTAMAEDRTLDYYASNNESEFFAQAYEAYLSEEKVHPLTHKAMNTREDLARKDPATFAFVDSLVQRQRAYLAGDTSALRSNWAQVYVSLAESAWQSADGSDAEEQFEEAEALLDSALVWDADYAPAFLSYAALMRAMGRFDDAESWLARAEAIDPKYAPIYSARAELVGARAAAAGTSGQLLDGQVALYRRALELERDLAVRARLNESLRRLYLRHARIPDAIAVAEEYVSGAPTISTYLRDRRDEAAAFAHELRAAAGYSGKTLEFFRELVGQKPQNYELREQYAGALVAAGRLDEALSTLAEAQRILRAGGRANAGFIARVAEIQLLRTDTAAARAAMEPILAGVVEPDGGELRFVRVLSSLGNLAEAHRMLSEYEESDGAPARAELAYTRAWMHEVQGDSVAAESALRSALDANPYHRRARVRLIHLLRQGGRDDEAAVVAAAAGRLALPLGPDFERESSSR
ncbi:MAG TPA: tetratricopeptide repeat protein, partial [Longimicrobiaceae bacterium]|nr:tetratricopeptide repeat protein [Longimicrobiaceae bacterium]